MSNIKLEKTLKKDKIFNILNKYYDEVYGESPFKSIILNIKWVLPKKASKEIKEYLKYVQEKRELTSFEIENFKNILIKIKDDLTKKFKKKNRAKKADRYYYEYEENKFYRLKDVRSLFDTEDEIYEEICFMNQ